MASPAEKTSPSIALEEFDQIFLKIFEDLGKIALEGAVSCTSSIMELSANYIDREAFLTLRKFQDLYFRRGEIEEKKDAVNAAVDDMVSLLQQRLEAGDDLSTVSGIDEDEEARQQRLSISAVQKQLEGLITLDNGIKEQVIPALSSMQFEDAVNQRLQHIFSIWKEVQTLLHEKHSAAEIEALARDIAKSLTAVEETWAFYTLVLEEAPPEGQDQRSIFIEF